MALKLIHAGIGGWGSDWAKNAVPPVKSVKAVAWVDAFEPTLIQAQEKMGLPADKCFTTLTEALEKVDADAVLVTTPAQFHVPVILEALAAGKHVITEKPFAPSMEEARSAVEAADKAGLILAVSQNYRQYPAPRKARDLVAEKKLGDLGHIRIDFRKWSNGGPPDGRHYNMFHPLLVDMSIHHFDLMRLIVGEEPESVFTMRTDPTYSQYKQEGSASVLVKFPSGVTISYRGSWASSGEPTTWSGDWNLECSEGEIYFKSRGGYLAGADDDEVALRPRDKAAKSVKLPRMKYWGRSQNLELFAQAIKTGVPPESSGRYNLGSIALMFAAVKSLESGEVEQVEKV